MGAVSHWAISAAGAVFLGACAASLPPRAPVTPPPRLVVPLEGDPEVHARAVAERARGTEVVYLGEMHDNPGHHALQARILGAIVAGGARSAVAFEMVAEGQQQALEDAVASRETAVSVERRLRWHAHGWPDFEMYWPLFDLARRHRLPVLALDLEPTLVRRITREGLAALGEAGNRLTSRLPPDAARETALTRRIQVAHCNLLAEARIPRMVESWYARNVTIASRLVEGLRRAGQVVVIIGRGHQTEGGVPAQLEALRPGTRQLVVELLEVRAGETGDAVARRGSGDVVWLTPALERPDPCAGLRQRLGGQGGAGA